jgi:ATP synthase F subunit
MAAPPEMDEQDGALLAVIADEDTITGFLLAGVGNVDLRKRSNFLVVDQRTTAKQVEQAFREFTSRDDVAIVLISQPIASMIRDVVAAYSSVELFADLGWRPAGAIQHTSPCALANRHGPNDPPPPRRPTPNKPPLPPPPKKTGHPRRAGDPVQGLAVRPVAGLAAAARQGPAGRAVRVAFEVVVKHRLFFILLFSRARPFLRTKRNQFYGEGSLSLSLSLSHSFSLSLSLSLSLSVCCEG